MCLMNLIGNMNDLFIPLNDLQNIEDQITSDTWKRQREILLKTLDTCYHKKFMDKAYEWLRCNIYNYTDITPNLHAKFLKDFKDYMNI